MYVLPRHSGTSTYTVTDVYNMQLSNEPAEELADFIIKESNGAFELCGFVSGGRFHIMRTNKAVF